MSAQRLFGQVPRSFVGSVFGQGLCRPLAGAVAIFALAAMTPVPSQAATATANAPRSMSATASTPTSSLPSTPTWPSSGSSSLKRKARARRSGTLERSGFSTAGGSYFTINKEIAAQAKAHVERRFGANSLWTLNPGTDEANLPPGRSSGADYMMMWTRVLEGDRGLGEDFDFIYFTGPSVFAAYFGLTGVADMEKIEARFDEKLKQRSRHAKGTRPGPAEQGQLSQLLRTARVRVLQAAGRTTSGTSCASSTSGGAARTATASPTNYRSCSKAARCRRESYEDAIAFGYAGRCVN